jgi:hypothetical protein
MLYTTTLSYQELLFIHLGARLGISLENYLACQYYISTLFSIQIYGIKLAVKEFL